MAYDDEENVRHYVVVMNGEEQYSIWLADRGLPAGWHRVGKTGKKAECLKYIADVWTDMRPRSLRRQMAAGASPAPLPDLHDQAHAAPQHPGAMPRE